MAKVGFWWRLLAGLIDLLLFLSVYAAAVPVVRKYMLHYDRAWVSVFIGNPLLLLYGLCEVFWGATPGKRMLRLRIAADDGSTATRSALLLRYLLKYSPRWFGLLDGLTMSLTLRRAAVWLGLPFFRNQPVEFITVRILGELALIALVVGFFFVLSQRRQSLHDWLSGTAVFRYPLGLGARGFEAIPLAMVVAEPSPQPSP